MKKSISLLVLAGILIAPSFARALEDPMVSSYPNKINANAYTFTIFTVQGATVTVIGGPGDIAPVTDGAEGDVLDGTVKVTVGLVQEANNVFSISAGKGSDFSNSITVNIQETAAGSAGQGDTTAPAAPKLDPVESPYSGTSIQISGSTEADANITARDPFGKTLGSTKANSNGIFHVDVFLTPGKTNRINIYAEDAAGNEGPAAQAVIQVLSGGANQAPSELPAPVPFTDVKGHWAEVYIEQLYRAEIVSGKTATTFDPNGLITRAELTKVAMKAFIKAELPVIIENPFSDVSAGDWYAPFVEQARIQGILAGYSDGTFKPNNSITRAEALKILLLASGLDYAGTSSYFSDVPQDAWFGPYVSYAKNSGIVGGYEDGTFKPENPVTRAEVTKMVSKILELK
jgi:hypothetical protein